MADVRVFGIRHHGPGCARALRAALDDFSPDCVLVEGPAEGTDVLPFAARAEMQPPIALLLYQVESPKDAVFYPFAVFSPEWQAIRFAAENSAVCRFMDLSCGIRFAVEEEEKAKAIDAASPSGTEKDADDPPFDPWAVMAEAAGFDDHEHWWEHQIERSAKAPDLFAAILESMRAIRDGAPPENRIEAMREAEMCRSIKTAEKDGFQKIAVVCGAYHAPVLVDRSKRKGDAEILRAPKKKKVVATWIPWTHSRLTSRSGYGAGVTAPGFYHHLFVAPDSASARWIVSAARLLRKEDLDASSASVIEAVRLADALAALRDRRAPGLSELNEAVRSVLAHGSDAPLAIVRKKLELGDILGAVPNDVPTVPIARDLEALQKSLRMKPSADEKILDLDLREETDRRRSTLLRRLVVLDIPWGEPLKEQGKKSGTFHEYWKLAWRAEFAVRVIEADVFGQTIESAADAKLTKRSTETRDLAELVAMLEIAVPAALPAATSHVIARIRESCALTSDIATIAKTLPTLARIVRYGDVRGTDATVLSPIIDGLFERLVIGLLPSSSSLDDQAARDMLEAVRGVRAAIDTLKDPELSRRWTAALVVLADAEVNGLLRGGALRELIEQSAIDDEEIERRTSYALSKGQPTADAASFVEGLVSGSGVVLLHFNGLWAAIDRFLRGLDDDGFRELLPILRRSFGQFSAPERRAMGEKAKQLGGGAFGRPRSAEHLDDDVDSERAARVLPVLARIFGKGRKGEAS